MIDPLCQSIFNEFNVDCFIETGTDKGETVACVSRWFADRYPEFGHISKTITDGAKSYASGSEPIAYPVFESAQVCPYEFHTVDVDQDVVQRVSALFESNPNIYIHESSSEQFLREFLKNELQDGSPRRQYMFFLDAHWGEYWPLRDELAVLTKLSKYMIVIDDFFVPEKSNPSYPHGDFGFDIYKQRILNWGYIRDMFGDDVQVYYPQQANRDNRGWVLITKGLSETERTFLSSLPFTRLQADDPIHTAPVRPTWRTHLDGKNLIKQCVPLSVLRRINAIQDKMSYKLNNR